MLNIKKVACKAKVREAYTKYWVKSSNDHKFRAKNAEDIVTLLHYINSTLKNADRWKPSILSMKWQ